MDFPTKQCTACKAIKPLDEFPHSFNWGKSRPRSRCHLCYLEYQRKQREAKRTANPPAAKPPKTHHTCTRCGETKLLSEFGVGTRRNGHEYPRPKCYQCCREISRKPRSEHKIRRTYTDPDTGRRMKQCAQCDLELPIAEFGFANERIKSNCRECDRKNRREIYWGNPEHGRALARAHYREHREECRERHQKWIAAHPEYRKQYQRANRVRIAANARARRASWSPEKRAAIYRHNRGLESRKVWEERNADRTRTQRAEKEQRRRARIRNSPFVGRVNRDKIIARDRSTCYLCGFVLSMQEIMLDHVIPLSRGGPHIESNLRVCCRSCNSRKGSRLLSEIAV